MVRVAIPIVQVTAPDGAKSLWVVALPYQDAVEAIKKLVPSDHTAELALRRWRSSPRLARLQPGEVRKMEPTLSQRPTYPNLSTSGAAGEDIHHFAPVSEYKAYAVARDGRIIGIKEMTCRDDREALGAAKRLARHSDVEVWNGDRFIMRLVRPKRESSAARVTHATK